MSSIGAIWRGIFLLAALAWSIQASAREAAFVEPGTATAKGGADEILTADPRQFEAGESTVGIARRVTMFFTNTGGEPLTISDVNAVGDGNVVVQLTGDDCKQNSKLAAAGRCSVTVSITPTSAGPWSVELLALHDGPGRIARGMIGGRAVNDAKASGRGEGLSIGGKEANPVDFGDVDIASDAAVRTALMVNDSPNGITIKSIDLVAVDKGLEKREQGCAVDQLLKSGESCPITLRWQPDAKGAIATDLIVHHTGKIGFTVIPVRGHARDDSIPDQHMQAGLPPVTRNERPDKSDVPPPPSAADIASAAATILPESVRQASLDDLGRKDGDDKIHFIGLVGDRAIVQRRGQTKVLAAGDTADFDGVEVELVAVKPKSAAIKINGKAKELALKASGYRPLPSVKKDQADPVRNAGVSSNLQSSAGKQSVDTGHAANSYGAATVITGK